MPTKWLQERPNDSKNDPGITLEGPCVVIQALRLHPVADGISMAHIASEDLELAGTRFKKATGCLPLFYSRVHDPPFYMWGLKLQRFKKRFVPG